jgi:hypothetical protein
MEIHRDFLRALPRRSFDICDVATKKDCGTVACVAGWIPFVPQFRKSGFESYIVYDEEYDFRYKGENVNILHEGAKFFGLTEEERSELFYPDSYKRGWAATPKDAAKKLDKIVRNARKERMKAGLKV